MYAVTINFVTTFRGGGGGGNSIVLLKLSNQSAWKEKERYKRKTKASRLAPHQGRPARRCSGWCAICRVNTGERPITSLVENFVSAVVCPDCVRSIDCAAQVTCPPPPPFFSPIYTHIRQRLPPTPLFKIGWLLSQLLRSSKSCLLSALLYLKTFYVT